MKVKNKISFKLLFAILAMMFALCTGATAMVGTVFAYSTASGKTQAENADVIDELWLAEDEVFDSTNMQLFMQKIEPLIADYSALSNTPISAQDIRDGNSGKDIVVKLGGLDWMVTCVSTNDDDNLIATLWLTDSSQLPREYTDASWASFLSAKVTSSDTYPVNMYGTSYMRSVKLNNGGAYATSTTETTANEQNESNVFAPFTMQSSALSQYIVSPNSVYWQKDYAYGEKAQLGLSYNYPNSILSTESTDFNSTTSGYPAKENYNDWGSDKLWLPSLAEVGERAGTGLWELSTAQKANASESPDQKTWLRTAGNSSKLAAVYYILQDGGGYDAIEMISVRCSVRPALHLNISSAYSGNVKTVNVPTGFVKDAFIFNGSTWYINNASQTQNDADFSNIIGFDSETMSLQGTTSASTAGQYTVSFALLDTEQYTWEDGTTENKTAVWNIVTPVTIPTLKVNVFNYNAKTWYANNASQTNNTSTTNFNNYNSSYMSYSGASATAPGSYTVTFKLTNSQYCWSDGTTADKTATWNIRLVKPTLNTSSIIYNGDTIYIGSATNSDGTGNYKDYYSDYMIISGARSATVPGQYSISFTLKSSSYTWSDGSTKAVSESWSIGLAKPTLTTSEFTYNNTMLHINNASQIESTETTNFANFESTYMGYTAEVSATNAGEYAVVFYLKLQNNSTYMWEDGSSEPVTCKWKISKASVSKPTISTQTYDYDGSAHKIVFDTYDQDLITILENNEQTAPGTYNVVVSLADATNYKWADTGDSNSYVVKLTINPKYKISLSVNYDSTCDDSATAFVTITKVNELGENIGGEWSIMFDGKSTSEASKQYVLDALDDGLYKVTVSSSTNHLATIASMTYSTTAYDMIVSVAVTKNNYGGFYGSSSSNQNLNYGAVVTSYLNFAGGTANILNGGIQLPATQPNANIALVVIASVASIAICGTVLAVTLGKKMQTRLVKKRK